MRHCARRFTYVDVERRDDARSGFTPIGKLQVRRAEDERDVAFEQHHALAHGLADQPHLENALNQSLLA